MRQDYSHLLTPAQLRARGAERADWDKDLLGVFLDPQKDYPLKAEAWREGYADRVAQRTSPGPVKLKFEPYRRNGR